MQSFEEFLTEVEVKGSDHYKFVHGKKPSGHGAWQLGIGMTKVDHSKHEEGLHYVRHTGKFSDAVKKAKQTAKKQGIGEVWVHT